MDDINFSHTKDHLIGLSNNLDNEYKFHLYQTSPRLNIPFQCMICHLLQICKI